MRRLKQLAYLLLFLVFWSLVVGGVYWVGFKPAASCFDRTQNQGEEGTDCGGPCQQFCIPATLQMVQVVGQPSIFQPTPDLLTAVVKLQNPNAGFAARAFTYVATIYGDGGASTTITGTSYIYAGEVKYLTLLHSDDGIGVPTRVTFAISSPVWQPQRLFAQPVLRIQTASTTIATDGSLRVDGTLLSDDARTVQNVDLVALFVDGSGTLLGVSSARLDSLVAGASTPFTVFHSPLSGIVPESTQVFVSAVRP